MMPAVLKRLDAVVEPVVQEALFPESVLPPRGDFRVLVTGWRDWPFEAAYIVEDALFRAFSCMFRRSGAARMVVVEGQCHLGGADEHAYNWTLKADSLGIVSVVSERHPAVVDADGRVHGAPRNTKMVNLGADLCLSFPNEKFLRQQGGTYDCTMKAIRAGIPTWTFHWNEKYRDMTLGGQPNGSY